MNSNNSFPEPQHDNSFPNFPLSEEEKKKLKMPKCSPEFLAWANQLSTDEEILAGIEEIRRTGGVSFEVIREELEKILAVEAPPSTDSATHPSPVP